MQGVNLNTRNLASLHTTPDCTMPEDRLMQGYACPALGSLFFTTLLRQTTSTDCDTNFNFNQGCGVNFTQKSYGTPFNDCDGGW